MLPFTAAEFAREMGVWLTVYGAILAQQYIIQYFKDMWSIASDTSN